MLVEITAACKSLYINDIVVSLFPAGAGMNLLPGPAPGRIRAVPRRRGDEPCVFPPEVWGKTCSPQARG